MFSILMGTFLYFLVMGFGINADANEYIRLSARYINTFLWLLMAISGSLLLREIREQHRIHAETESVRILQDPVSLSPQLIQTQT